MSVSFPVFVDDIKLFKPVCLLFVLSYIGLLKAIIFKSCLYFRSVMASTLTEDHLTCTICYQPFTEPKTLQCLHSFCHDCIQQYINHAAKVRGFPCPMCRELTMPPDSMQPKSQWARQLKTDFKLKAILEAVNQIEKGKWIRSCNKGTDNAIPPPPTPNDLL